MGDGKDKTVQSQYQHQGSSPERCGSQNNASHTGGQEATQPSGFPVNEVIKTWFVVC